MDGTLDFVREQVAAGRRVALVSVTGSAGSSPASEGQAMAVLADGTARGTVGGGACEERLRLAAVEAIRSGRKTFEFFFDLAETGMVCGGSVKGYGHIFGDERRLLIFGGGHISQCLAPLALSAGFAVRVVDDRPEFAERFPGIPYLACPPEAYEKELVLDGETYAVICTRGHRTDSAALRFCLGRPHRYLGMIGSLNKKKAIFDGLAAEGFDRKLLDSVYAPIGLDIASEVPAEIALAIMAEILLVKNGGTAGHRSAAQSALGRLG